jgi:hypothetical protein
MSKYEPLWNYVKEKENDFILNYEQVEKILGFPIDHSFLTFKKELTNYGWQVGKISTKNKNIEFIKI